MKRIILAIVAATFVSIGWGMLSWMVLPWHTATMRTMATPQAEVAVKSVLQQQIQKPGVYYFPAMPDADATEAEWSAYQRAHLAGPTGMIYIDTEGSEVMPSSMLVKGNLTDLACVILVALLVLAAGERLASVGSRMLFIIGLGLLVALGGDVRMMIWMRIPADFALTNAADQVVRALLISIPLALLLPRGKSTAEAGDGDSRVPTPDGKNAVARADADASDAATPGA